MKKVLGIGVVCLAVILAGGVVAWAAEETKIGVVNLERAMNESQRGLKAKKEMDMLKAEKEKGIEKKKEEIKKIESDLEKQGKVLSDEKRREKEANLQKEYKDLERMAADARDELQRKKAEIGNRLLIDLLDIIRKAGEEEKYLLILEQQSVLYTPKTVDLTDKVIKRYNDKK
ncbi:MAG: OmpH family outer membrane protein [Nitrospirae bacterium]|nr:OmpH family outer membrane protein [Nitrospirota bacterium]